MNERHDLTMDTTTDAFRPSENAMTITCQSSLGHELREPVSHLTRHSVVFETSAPECALRTSELLRNVRRVSILHTGRVFPFERSTTGYRCSRSCGVGFR